MEMKVVRTEDLGNEWEAHFWSDGSLTLQDNSGGDIICLPNSSVNRLEDIFQEADKLAA